MYGFEIILCYERRFVFRGFVLEVDVCVNVRMASSTSRSSGSEKLKWLVVPENREELLNITRTLVREIREITDEQTKLQKLKGNEEMTEKLDEVLREVECQFDKIAATVQTSDMVFMHLKGLRQSIQNIYEFYVEVANTNFMIFAKGRLRKRMVVLYNSIRHSCTQLMASVSLELLTKKEVKIAAAPPPPPPPEVTFSDLDQELLEGHQFFYAINRSRNYTRAFKHYVFAAERGHIDSMISVSAMFLDGLGVDKNEEKGIAWLERAKTLGSAAASYRLAMIILDKVCISRFHPLFHHPIASLLLLAPRQSPS
jgi:hypothetical protein